MEQSHWQPSRQSATPLHMQITQYIRDKIVGGEWPVGTRIPSQRKLAEAFKVNRSTVVTALDELTAAGMLEGCKGGGTRVVNHTWGALAATPPTNWNDYVKSGIHRPNLPAVQEINRAEFHPGVIRLGTGELSPELLPHLEMSNVLRRVADRTPPLGYGEPMGDLRLRELLAARLQKLGIAASPASVLIVSGALQALQLISVGLLEPGSAVLVERPSYLYSVPVFQSAGMKLRGVPMDENGLRADLVGAYARQYNASLLYTIPTFHNPSGTTMSEARRAQLMEVTEAGGLPVIEDDVYRDLWLDAPPPRPLKARDASGNVLYLGSLSKTVSPGLRIGWIAGPQPVLERLADIKMQSDYGSSTLSQQAAAEWLGSGMYEQHMERIRERLRERRAVMLNSLDRHFAGIASWKVPAGGFYVWLKLHAPLPARTLFDQALRRNILINPGHLYDRDANQHIRLSYAFASLDDMERSLAQLAEIIESILS
ncbi:PLP-dependent aminotransferase family protein [Paenibacillus woosongensis]|uniref:Aminotransferase class I/II-fold pyridoxal phosphate-dependent enzyme n=1 Tax=Paenibacillus woosongensis TaxID=307580 RepID=A0A7X2Z2P2_9BACL|nr:PLP-dependent aminotransferase family protein [Paenibacillus woosongensis]MUG46355.1 aminotransferase class I/II-fold pyridoxal phosphate-dependent enzyme [Paenibacillus woosongensis]